MLSRNRRNGRGAILFGVLIVILMVSLIGASLAALLSSLALTNQFEIKRVKALYLAEAGISYAIHMLKSQAIVAVGNEYFIPPTQLNDGTFEVRIDFSQSLISSTGKCGGLKRKIQLKYNPF